VVNGAVLAKSAFRGTGTQDFSLFVEERLRIRQKTVLLRLEGFNLFNHGNILGRAQTIYGDASTPGTTFGQLVAVGAATAAIPAWPTSIRRGCFSSRCGLRSNLRRG
jgi:hypothetical protein